MASTANASNNSAPPADPSSKSVKDLDNPQKDGWLHKLSEKKSMLYMRMQGKMVFMIMQVSLKIGRRDGLYCMVVVCITLKQLMYVHYLILTQNTHTTTLQHTSNPPCIHHQCALTPTYNIIQHIIYTQKHQYLHLNYTTKCLPIYTRSHLYTT